MKKQKMTRDTIPEDFTLSLALIDALPVLFFGGSIIFNVLTLPQTNYKLH